MRQARFDFDIGGGLVPVTKTEVSTIYEFTATTAITFKCTPSSSILNLCP